MIKQLAHAEEMHKNPFLLGAKKESWEANKSVSEEKEHKRIVVKVGTSTLVHPSGGPNFHNMEILSRVLSDMKGIGHEVILVSSGAIGIGTGKLRLPERPKQLRMKQAVAAVGQCEMMHLYDKFHT